MLETHEFLGKTLIQEGLLDREQLDQAQELADEAQCTIDEAIVSLGYLDARRIAVTKAQICEAPYVDLDTYEINLANCALVPRSIAQQHLCFPLFVLDGVLTLGIDDPLNVHALDQVRSAAKMDVDPVLCDPKSLRELINRAYTLMQQAPAAGQNRRDDLVIDTPTDDSGPIVAAVNTIINDAIKNGASDIHINPDQNELYVRFRIDGVLHQRQGPPLSMHPKIVQRLKVMAHLDLTQTRRPQDGKIRITCGDAPVDLRVSIIPTIHGENVVVRILNGNTAILKFADLGVDPDTRRILEDILELPYGMLLVTGPTGSGKTTTLYTALSKLNSPDRNIITIEDPVEIRLPMVRQMQVNHEIGLNFATALRTVLRQDPDVVLVGEIRDQETAAIAMQASLTGHLVFSTLHTNDAAGAVARLVDFGLPPFVINSAMLGVVAQRLVRRVCPHCIADDVPTPELTEHFRIEDPTGFKRGRGCTRCLQTGYLGRLGVFEMIRFTHNLQSAIAANASTQEIREISVADGTRLMWQHGLDHARMGLTTIDEVRRMVTVWQADDTAGLNRCAYPRRSA